MPWRTWGWSRFRFPRLRASPACPPIGASDIRTVNESLERFDASVEHFKQTALDAEKKLKKARAGQSAARADALLNEWLSGDPASLIQVAEGSGELLQELLNGLKKRQYAGAAFLLCVDSSSLLLGAYCGKDAIADGLSAGDLVREVSSLAGGKGRRAVPTRPAVPPRRMQTPRRWPPRRARLSTDRP